jgi:hypothetical protein
MKICLVVINYGHTDTAIVTGAHSPLVTKTSKLDVLLQNKDKLRNSGYDFREIIPTHVEIRR